MAARAIRMYRSDSGMLEIAPGHRDTWWSQVQDGATVEYVEPLAGWGKYVALYRVRDERSTQLYAVTGEE